MSTLEMATWAAIVVLVGGSLGVFAWFLADAIRWLRSHPSRRRRAQDGARRHGS
jgi:hypothetical protein